MQRAVLAIFLTVGFLLTSIVPLAPVEQAHAIVTTFVTGETSGRKPLALFGSGMVLQRDLPVPIFGSADPGEDISVQVAGQLKFTTAGIDGKWQVDLDPTPAGGPYQVVITGDINTIYYEDVMFGEVWVATGQSNMMRRRVRAPIRAQYPLVRTLLKKRWGEGVGGVPFAFANELQQELGVAVGVIVRANRGSSTKTRTWLGPSAVNDPDPFIQAKTAEWDGEWGNQYYALIQPIQPYAMRGVIWWHGERALRSFSGPTDYGHLLPAIIRSWRNDWGTDFGFVAVLLTAGEGLQIGESIAALPADPNDYHPAPVLRQSFIRTMAVDRVALVTSGELGGGRHPRDHEEYSRRLAHAALSTEYGFGTQYAGPTFSSATIEGNQIRIRFRENTAIGLLADGTAEPVGFQISADGEFFVWAEAQIQGEEVVVWSDDIPVPLVARYGFFKSYDWANLSNIDGFVAPSFTTEIDVGEYLK